MGNGIYGYCVPERKDISGNTFCLLNSLTPYEDELHKITKVQSNVRVYLAKNKLSENSEEVNKQFDVLNYGEYVEKELIVKRRGEKLLKIEEEFHKTHGCLNHLQQDISQTTPRGTVYKQAILLLNSDSNDYNNNNEIYEGHWKFNSNLNTFIRLGYGCLYREDGSKIEGRWVDKRIADKTKGRIYFPSGKIYQGDILTVYEDSKIKYFPHGQGDSFYPSEFSSKQILNATWERDQAHGEALEVFPNKFSVKVNYNKGVIDFTKAVFTYPDATKYEGHFDKKYHRCGFGVMYFPNGDIYEGHWKKDKQQGSGLFFSPSKNTSEAEDNFALDPTVFKFKDGAYTKAFWVDGYLHGEGTVTTRAHVTHCLWRFGKLIQSNVKLSKIVSLHENIYSFLTSEELVKLLHLKNRQIKFFFTKNNQQNLIKLKLGLMMMSDSRNYLSPSASVNANTNANAKTPQAHLSDTNLRNNFTFTKTNRTFTPTTSNFLIDNSNRIQNVKDVIRNYNNNINQFIPIVAYNSDGGFIHRRFHYSHLFHPDQKKAYSSNYLITKKNDIEVLGALKEEFYESDLNKQVYRDFREISNSNLTNSEKSLINKLLTFSNALIPLYNALLKKYKLDFYQIKIEDRNVLAKDKSLSLSLSTDYFFSVHQIVINVPVELCLYTILGNPVRTFAVYLSNENSDDDNNNYQDNLMNSEVISSLNILHKDSDVTSAIDMNKLELFIEKLRTEFLILKVHNNNNNNVNKNIVIEFDTRNTQNTASNTNKKKLLALIFLLDYTEPHLINLKQYYHFGQNVTIKLIDQLTAFNYNKTGIDVGSVLFYGQVYSLIPKTE